MTFMPENTKGKIGNSALWGFLPGILFKRILSYCVWDVIAALNPLLLTGNRDIRIMKGPRTRPAFLNHATTLWMASPARKNENVKGLHPFGWAGISRLDADLETRLSERENAYTDLKAQEEKEQLAEAAVADSKGNGSPKRAGREGGP